MYLLHATNTLIVIACTGRFLHNRCMQQGEPQESRRRTSGLDLARGLYSDHVAPILAAEYPKLRYSAALIGPGSEVLGFDDETSRDHHWGPRLQLFLSVVDHADLGSEIRELLGERLPFEYRGFSTNFAPPGPNDGGTQLLEPSTTRPVNHRVEVLGFGSWLSDYLGIDPRGGLDAPGWLSLPSQKLRSLVAGEVFHDDLRGDAAGTEIGALRALRHRLEYYPDAVWRYQLAASWARIGQDEHLVGRAGQVGDEIGAAVIAARLVREMMRLVLLANRQYPPYAKWLGTAFAHAAARMAPELPAALQAILAAPDWRSRNKALIPAYEAVARVHNDLRLTTPLAVRAVQFFGRPFHVIAVRGFCSALIDTIDEPWLSSVLRRSPIGGIDLLSDNTDLLEEPELRGSIAKLYRTR